MPTLNEGLKSARDFIQRVSSTITIEDMVRAHLRSAEASGHSFTTDGLPGFDALSVTRDAEDDE